VPADAQPNWRPRCGRADRRRTGRRREAIDQKLTCSRLPPFQRAPADAERSHNVSGRPELRKIDVRSLLRAAVTAGPALPKGQCARPMVSAANGGCPLGVMGSR
jgi:hypothetical protein